MTTESVKWAVMCLIKRAEEHQTEETVNYIDYEDLLESLTSICEKSNRYEDILDIVKSTDYENEVSINEIGEDYGYREGMYETAIICGWKWRK